MARETSPEIDDELFNEVYGKEYTGPPRPISASGSAANNSNKRPHREEAKNEDGDDVAPDPNAVPTDFTSREARVWEAKAKALERNWKKRKEEELICKLCGEAGHFTQGCPSTLGANRKTADFFERVPARDKQVRSLFTDKVITQVEKDVGCKIKMEEKFLIVSGKDRLILSKGVDAVHKLIQDDKNKSSTGSHRPRSKSPVRAQSPLDTRARSPRDSRARSPRDSRVRSPIDSRYRRSDSQKSHSSPRSSSHFQGRPFNQERVVEDRVREDLQKLSRDSRSPYAYANDGSRGQPTHSRSPPRSSLRQDHSAFDGYNHNTGVPKTDNYHLERRGNEFQSEKRFDNPYPQNLEDLELEFKRETMEVGKIRDLEEDEENYKHRECIRVLREDYMKKLVIMRGMHMKQWEEFLQLDIQKRQQQTHHNAFNQPAFTEYNQSRDAQYVGGSNLQIDSRNRPPYPNEEYPASRQPDFYSGDFQHQRNDDFGRTYGRY